MDKINPEDVANKYNKMPEIWPASDPWHIVTHKMISKFIKQNVEIEKNSHLKILNAGSAGNNYGLPENNVTHIDLADNSLREYSNSVIGTIENLPFADKSFDIIICVGSVINYCDPINAIREFKRVIMPNGFMILEFENSYTLELLGKKTFNRPAALIKTFYDHQVEKIWYFSETYIKKILEENKLNVIKKNTCHIISPLVYRWIKNENWASSFSVFDSFLKLIPGIKEFSSNSILLIQSNC